MKILIDNYNGIDYTTKEFYPKKLVCENCNSELEYDKSDLRIGVYGCAFLDCPLCTYSNEIDGDGEELVLNKDNVEFPTHFWHTSTETGAVDVCTNENIKKYIKKAIDYFRNNKDCTNWNTSHRNLLIQVNRYEGDEMYEVIVTNNYYDLNIPFERIDY